VEIEKVHDVAVGEAVPQVAERAAEDQRQARAQQPPRRVAPQHPADDSRGEERHRDEERRLPAGLVGEEAEGRAAVEHQHQVEETRDLQRLSRPQPGKGSPLG
jgi:hypothetical protein